MFADFDDEIELPERQPRPVYMKVDEVQVAALFHATEAARLHREAVTKAVEGEKSEVWKALNVQVVATADDLANGRFLAVIQSEVGRTLLRAVDEDERDTTDLAKYADLVNLFRWRAIKFVVQGDHDGYLDEAGSPHGPAAYRALLVVFVAAACLSAYTQANWTGPEFSLEDTKALQPLPFARSLLSAAALEEEEAAQKAAASVATDAWRKLTPGEQGIRDFSKDAAAGAAASAAGAAADAAAIAAAGAASASPAAAAAAGGDDDADDKEFDSAALHGMMRRRRTTLQKACLAALNVSGEDVYEHAELPLLLLTGRALLTAVLQPVGQLRRPAVLVGDAPDVEAQERAALARAAAAAGRKAPSAADAVAAAVDSAAADAGASSDSVDAGADLRYKVYGATGSGTGSDDLDDGVDDAAEDEEDDDAAAIDPRYKKLYGATGALFSACWWAGRGCLLHQRSLIDRSPNALLWHSCCGFYRRGAKLLVAAAAAPSTAAVSAAAYGVASTASSAPESSSSSSLPLILRAFIRGDVFQRKLIQKDLRAATLTDAGSRAVDGDDATATSSTPATSDASAAGAAAGAASAVVAAPAPTTAESVAADRASLSVAVPRLLLEWGNTQHFFGRTSSAKTSFLLAKRHTGLQTLLTGALGRRTRFQRFDLAQLVLRAASSGSFASIAVQDAVNAEAYGAADGPFSAAALRKAGVLAATSGAGAVATAAGADAPAAASSVAAAPAAAAPAATAAVAPSTGAAGVAPSAVGGAAAAGAAAVASDDAAPAAPSGTVSLGGVQTFSLESVDASNILLENIKFRDPALIGVKTKEDEEFERLVYGKGWGKAMEDSIAATAAATATAAAGGAPAAPAGTTITTDASTAAAAAASGAAGSSRLVLDGGASSTAPAVPALVDAPISALDQCILLALCLDIKNHSPSDGLTTEEMRPYIARSLDTPLSWMVFSTGLLVRSWHEVENHRTMERAVLQMQALVDQHTNRITAMQSTQRCIDESAPAHERLAYLFALAFPPRWELKRQLADRYRQLGVLRSALQLYEELELWDDIIDVYVALEKRSRATKLLRQRLAIAPSPRLWCTLGTVTDKDEHFLTAWESSNKRYARAQLELGKRLFRRRDAPAAVKALQLGLTLAPHHNKEWYILGLITMQYGRYDVALEAFSRVVQLEPSSADAWANIGSIYLQQRSWNRGFTALEQALRMDRKDWRVWSNFLVACMQLHHYSRAIAVMHTLVDIKKTGDTAATTGNDGVDIPALAVLVGEVLASLRETSAAATAAAAAAGAAAGAASGAAAATAEPGAAAPAAGDDEQADARAAALASAGVSAAAPQQASATAAAAGGTGTSKLEHVDITGQPASIYLEPLAKLFGHITSAVTKFARVWQLYARVQGARGRRADATTCREKMTRAAQIAGWEKEEAGVVSVVRAANELLDDYFADGSGRALMQARMFLGGIVTKVEVAGPFKDHEAVVALRGRMAGLPAL